MTTYGGTETTLTVTGFSKESVGQYQCIATNQYGEAQQNIFVDLASEWFYLSEECLNENRIGVNLFSYKTATEQIL